MNHDEVLGFGSKIVASQGRPDDLVPVESESRFERRVSADPETVERGLAQLVLTLIELLRQLMERQAVRRMETGSLDDEQIERLGETFMKLAQRMEELKVEFGLRSEDLNLDLGPLGTLL